MERGFDEKIDVIDLIINVLKDHEKTLDELVTRLEETQATSVEAKAPQGPQRHVSARVTAVLKKWVEFTQRCSGAQLIAFDIEDEFFEASAVAGGVVYIYREEIPSMDIQYVRGEAGARIESIDISKAGLMTSALRGRLDCGLEFEKKDIDVALQDGRTVHKIVYDIDPGTARSWLAYQLGVDDSSIVHGKLKA